MRSDMRIFCVEKLYGHMNIQFKNVDKFFFRTLNALFACLNVILFAYKYKVKENC